MSIIPESLALHVFGWGNESSRVEASCQRLECALGSTRATQSTVESITGTQPGGQGAPTKLAPAGLLHGGSHGELKDKHEAQSVKDVSISGYLVTCIFVHN